MAQRKSLEKKIVVWAWLFVTPALLFFTVFSFYQIANDFYLSFCNKNMISLKPPVFIGFANYIKIFASADFWNSVRATVVFTLGTFIPLVIGSMILAAFLTFRPAGSRILQLIYYSPAVLSSVVAALIWKLIFEPRGIANQAANAIMMTSGIDFKWLSNGIMLQISTMVVYFWKYIGYFTVLFLTGLGKIPRGIYEAALIDGAIPRANLFPHYAAAFKTDNRSRFDNGDAAMFENLFDAVSVYAGRFPARPRQRYNAEYLQYCNAQL